MNEGKESITEFAKRMRELTGLSENEAKKSVKTLENGESPTTLSESVIKEEDDFIVHEFEQKGVERHEDDDELYAINENTIIELDFLEEDEDTLGHNGPA